MSFQLLLIVMAPQKRSRRKAEEPIEEEQEVAVNVDQGAVNEAVQRELSRKIHRVAELEEELSRKELMIVGKNDVMRELTVAFKTTLALKNRKITDLEKEVAEIRTRNSELMKELTTEKAKTSLHIFIQELTKHDPNPTVIRTIFPNVSKITRECYSKEVSYANAKWSFFIMKSDGNLSYYVRATALDNSERSSWHGFLSFRLLSHLDGSVLLENNHQLIRFVKGAALGRPDAILFEKLLDPIEKFVKEDAIIAEVAIRECDSPLQDALIAQAPLAVQPAVT